MSKQIWKKLTAKRIEFLRRKLEDELAELVLKEESSPLGGCGGMSDEVDCATASWQFDLAVTQKKLRQKRIRDIKKTLQLMNQGVYGICPECDEPVEAQRLQKNPTRVVCAECQIELDEEEEKQKRMQKHSSFRPSSTRLY